MLQLLQQQQHMQHQVLLLLIQRQQQMLQQEPQIQLHQYSVQQQLIQSCCSTTKICFSSSRKMCNSYICNRRIGHLFALADAAFVFAEEE
jgi:hypothetical protein